VPFAATGGMSARNNVVTATAASTAANAAKIGILLRGTDFVALAANRMTVSSVSETTRLTRRQLTERYSNPKLEAQTRAKVTPRPAKPLMQI
jgi:hypothetical protein